MTKDEALKLALEALKHTHPSALTSFYTIGDRDKAIKSIQEHLAQPEGCQCSACKVTPHTSDCAVHNEPAYPKGECNCGVQRTWVNATTWRGLTEAQCGVLWKTNMTPFEYYQAIEAKLKEKNA